MFPSSYNLHNFDYLIKRAESKKNPEIVGFMYLRCANINLLDF